MSSLRVLDSPAPLEVHAASEVDEALLALRSGAWLTVAGDLMLLGALVISQVAREAGRIDVQPAAWVMLGAVLAGQCGAVAAVELGQSWIGRTFSADAIYRYCGRHR